MNKRDISEIIKSRRKQTGLTHLALSEEHKIDTHAITRIEKNYDKEGYTVDTLLRLLDVLGLELVVREKP